MKPDRPHLPLKSKSNVFRLAWTWRFNTVVSPHSATGAFGPSLLVPETANKGP